MFNKTILALILGSQMFIAGSSIAASYKIDTEGQHAFIGFKIKHLDYSWVYGRFNDFSGNFTFDEKDPTKDKIDVTIKTGSIDTNHAERDKHLSSADYLNAGKFPEAKFVSTSVRKISDIKYDVTGDLTLNGITKPVVLDAKLIGEGKDPWGGYRAGFEAKGTIKLGDFNIEKGKGLGPASQEVELIISVEGVRQ